MRDLISFHASLTFHCLLLLLLAFVTLEPDKRPAPTALLVGPQRDGEELEELLEPLVDTRQEPDQQLAGAILLSGTAIDQARHIKVMSPVEDVTPRSAESRPGIEAEYLPLPDLLMTTDSPVGGGLEGRSQRERARLVDARGGNAASENAVELGLEWLAAHQRQNGSWLLDHTTGPCAARCADPGAGTETSIGATGLALLAFLGAGYTQSQGKYQEVVGDGLQFLQKQMRMTNFGGDFSWDSTTAGMYAHGLATLALCEAYAMTGDESLRPFLQPAVDYICSAQGPRGGWRYRAGQPGDTTVTGWQVMALKSARLANLFVSSETTENANYFLNTVQDGNGAFYGYMTPNKEPGPTAVGLLLRMYLGWSRQDERLQRGINYLVHHGPSTSDMYFNYYSTQVLHHYQGPSWAMWNETMRDFLIASQATAGHARGSWFFADRHGSVGGRHYTTAICTMILEVYYRHMPLYGEEAVGDSL
jgi:hypothetical protein